jgi:hypothetical protein
MVRRMLEQLTFLAAQGASGDDPSGTGGVIIIVAIVLAVLIAGVVIAKKAFTRGEMASTPSEDSGKPDPDGVDAKQDPKVSHDPTAVGRPSERGYEQNL